MNMQDIEDFPRLLREAEDAAMERHIESEFRIHTYPGCPYLDIRLSILNKDDANLIMLRLLDAIRETAIAAKKA